MKKTYIVLALLLSLCFIDKSFALDKSIEKVEVYPSKKVVKLIIKLSYPFKPRISWLPGDRERMIISFDGFIYRATLRKLSIRREDVWEVRGGQYTKGEARVVVEFFSERLQYESAERDGGKTIVFYFYPVPPRGREPVVSERRLFYIEDIDASLTKDVLRVVISGGPPLDPKVNWVKGDKGPDSLILDFHGFALRKQGISKDINTFGVLSLRAFQFTPEIVRLVVNLEGDRVNYKLERDPSGRQVLLYFFPKHKEKVPPLRKPEKVEPIAPQNWASKKVSLEFRDTDIRDVFRALAKAVDLNIVLDQSVSGTVTVGFRDVPFAQAFDWLLKISNLSYRNLGDTIIIGKEDRLKELFDKKETKVFVLSNALASNVVKAVSDITGMDSIIVDPRMNALIVKASPSDLKRVEEVIKLLDQEVPQVMVEAKLVGITLERGKSLGFILSNISKGKFYNINITPGSEITISYSSDEKASAAFDATINAWVSSGRARVLASPSVATLSGMKAVVNLTRDYKYYSRVEEISDSEKTITQKWETITYGPQLVITPYVGEEDKITLDIDIDVSIVTRWIEYRDQRVPEIGHRKVTTKLRVKDGQPIIIGGLITEEDVKNLLKVPLLGDIPFLGTLFRSETSSRTREEVVLIVTPRILKD